MSYTLTVGLAVLAYCASGVLLWHRLIRGKNGKAGGKALPLLVGAFGVGLHAGILRHTIFTSDGINFGFSHAVSLIAWLIALLLLVTALRRPVENLGIAVLPLGGLAILLEYAVPSVHFLPAHLRHLEIHILLSIVAYSLLSIAALQALLLAVQDRHLHNKHPGGFIRMLPPLQTMEELLFKMIAVGFVLQSLSLASGLAFMDDIFAQHLAHKTILSIIAWVVFAILLWGRWRFGWRGRVAIRWTLGGFVALALAYLGSKLVLEIILGR
ncbi:MAG TPA: phosphohydrolase [Gammaproteobacteria bacterium]|nr:phosphohydrolase [Gammaproteobacteria bacterium]